MSGQLLRDICESNFQLVEQKEKKAGVLGIVEGVFFVSDTPSRNQRVYPRGLWERVLSSEDINRLLSNRLLIGTVGHEDVDFDALIREQKVSHVVTRLWMNEDGKGYGNAEILDTPVGRILYTLLKNGSKMAVSSKGWGDYKGQNENGYNVVDENSFILERFDFVVDPGFVSAVPGLKEQYENLVGMKDEVKKEVKNMDMMEALIKEKLELQERLSEVMNELKTLKKTNEELEQKLKEKDSKIDWEGKLKKIAETWTGVSDVEELKKELRLVGKIIEEEADKLVEKGVKDHLLKGNTLSEVLLKVLMEARKKNIAEGRIFERKKFNEEIKKKDVVWRGEIRKRDKSLESMRKQLREAKEIIAAVNKLGGINKITESLIKARRIIKAMTDAKVDEEVKRISAKYGIGLKETKELVDKVGFSKAESILKSEVRKPVRKEVVMVEDRKPIEETLANRVLKAYAFGIKENK